MKDIVIIGGPGFGEEIVWLLERINKVKKQFNILGFINKDIPKGQFIGKYKVLGDDDFLNRIPEGTSVCIAIGNSKVRQNIVEKMANLNLEYPSLIDPTAQISETVTIGKGCIICSNTVFTTNIQISDYSIINLSCTVGHGCKLNRFSTILPGCNISGEVELDEACSIGTGAQIIPGCHIGCNSIIGAGAVVIDNIDENCTAVGIPAKVINK